MGGSEAVDSCGNGYTALLEFHFERVFLLPFYVHAFELVGDADWYDLIAACRSDAQADDLAIVCSPAKLLVYFSFYYIFITTEAIAIIEKVLNRQW